jgi:hypothetical protein
VPLLRAIVPRQRAFAADIKVINDCLDGLILSARANSEQLDEETLQNRDYSKVSNGKKSLLMCLFVCNNLLLLLVAAGAYAVNYLAADGGGLKLYAQLLKTV